MEFLKKDIMGLPVWAWGLVIVGGVIVGYVIIKAQNSATASPGAASTPIAPTDATSAGGAVGSSGFDASQFVTNDQLQQALASLNSALSNNSVATQQSTASGTSPNLVPSAGPSPAPVAVASHTPAGNLGTIQGYLNSIPGGGNVHQVGKAGTAQSAYVVAGPNVVKSALVAHFGAGWTILQCGSTYLVKGPKATNVKFGPNCVPTGYD